jgi:valyl-tRNA synthetase
VFLKLKNLTLFLANERQKEADALAKIETIEHSLAGLK